MRRRGTNQDFEFSRNQYPPKPAQYSSSSNPTDADFTAESFVFDSDSSRNPSSQQDPRFSSYQSSMDQAPRRTISMGAGANANKAKTLGVDREGVVREPGGYRRNPSVPGTLPRHFTQSYSTNRTNSSDHHRMGSDGSSMYSSSSRESIDSNDDFGYPARPPKPQKFVSNSSASSNQFSGNFYPNPMDASELRRLQSGFSSTNTDTTLTNGNSEIPNDLDEMTSYFNRKLDDMKRRADAARRRKESYMDDSDTEFQSFNNGQRRGIRPSNRASMQSDASTLTPTNSRLATDMSTTDTNISNMRDEVEELKAQIGKGMEFARVRGGKSPQEMEEMAEYFQKRLRECQNRVQSAVSKVQSQVGEMKTGYDRRTDRRRSRGYQSQEEYYDSSDSGIGPKKLTIRPPARAAAGVSMQSEPPPLPLDRSYSTQPSAMTASVVPPRYRDVGPYPTAPPMDEMRMEPPMDQAEFIDPDSESERATYYRAAPKVPVPGHGPLDFSDTRPDMFFEEEENVADLGSDAEEEWDDFEEYIDDDTPAPETAIPVPKIKIKDNNYLYQSLYCIYIATFLAYVYVRITYTLDAPGLNRIYCVIVAILEIITAPSLILQGLCMWRWIHREQHESDPHAEVKFHTARIMIPTYKEPLEVVAGTVHEVIHMILPPHFHVHVYVLDDGKRESLESWVLSKRTNRRVFLHYVARPKLPGIPHHAKAGNINHTLKYIYDDAYAERECVIIFDADFMPRRNYLLRVLPVFSEKRTRPLALVQTPQFFYNVNPDEDVWDHLNVSFFHRIEPSLDRWSAVNCCGTNFTVRADALKDVGYFPVGCLTEDTLLSLRLCTMGWGVAYHHEVLAIGQSPHEITEIFKQRSRWCKGNLQIFLDEFPLMQSGLSLSQRVFYSSCGFNYFCASISIPFFQLVPTWAIFFGLWPVSRIGLEFAFAFFIYYCCGSLLLLFPPPGFGIKDTWNGELASTNLWFTYFNGVRRIVGTKLMQGKGELTFKTTKKKTDDDEDSSTTGFQKEDVRACYMHFIMFFIMFVTIIYAIIRAITAVNVKFYFYYMYMIGMSWALINMTPYLIVVIYCWYRVRIPGLLVSCFRNVQLLLRVVCAALIMVQAFTTRNLTENFTCPHEYTGELGVSPLAMVQTPDVTSGLMVTRNAFWLLGLKDDFYTIQQIKQTACTEDEIPVIVLFMHPSQGLVLDEEAGHYMPDYRIETWLEYDEKLEEIANHLSDVPSIIVMEPALLMHTFNSNAGYHNAEYQIAYNQRVEMATRLFPQSWVYVDAGNAMYLQWNVNLEHIIGVLKKMPPSMRGFTINVGSFVNSTFNQELADEIHCQTGLHYIIDTSRNGGRFSDRTLDEINKCTYDPPDVYNGSTPMWREGSEKRKLDINVMDIGDLDATEVPDYSNRRKRWTLDYSDNQPAYAEGVVNPSNPAAGGVSNYDYDGGYYDSYGAYGGGGLGSAVCVTEEVTGLDAFAWIKTPGEADGRLFPAGTYHPCLQGHVQDCNDAQCPQYVPKVAGDFQRMKSCECV